MELRVGVQEGMLDRQTHRVMKMLVSYVSTMYNIRPSLMDLEGAIFDDVDERLCAKIVNDVRKKFRHRLKFMEIECL